MTNQDIAEVCHEANRVFCEASGDYSQRSWELASEWQRDSAEKGVAFALANPDAPDSAQHDAWCKDKHQLGWEYGPEKNAAIKTHPCMVPFEELSRFDQAKDGLFRAIVRALAVTLSVYLIAILGAI